MGELQFSRQGQKEVSAFRYSPAWLSNPDCFALSPDLPLSTDFQYRTGSKETSTFAGAIADTEPDGWGRRVIDRAHAKRRKADGPFLDVPHDDNLPEGTHEVPLQTLIQASNAVESGKETAMAALCGRCMFDAAYELGVNSVCYGARQCRTFESVEWTDVM